MTTAYWGCCCSVSGRAIAAMLLTAVLSARYGSRPIILAGEFGLAVLLPLLVVAGSPLSLGLTLFGSARRWAPSMSR